MSIVVKVCAAIVEIQNQVTTLQQDPQYLLKALATQGCVQALMPLRAHIVRLVKAIDALEEMAEGSQ